MVRFIFTRQASVLVTRKLKLVTLFRQTVARLTSCYVNQINGKTILSQSKLTVKYWQTKSTVGYRIKNESKRNGGLSMNCIIYNLRIGCDSKCPGPGHVQLPPVWRVSQYTVTRCHVGCVSHAAVTRCCHTGKAVIVITDQCIDHRLLWGEEIMLSSAAEDNPFIEPSEWLH